MSQKRDAPPGVSFFWPYLRYIGPLLGTACCAPVEDGILGGPLLRTTIDR